MRRTSIASLFLFFAFSCAPDVNDGPDPEAGADDDGDNITNGDEGSGNRTDTDGDGTPDFEDTDSDNDGILDEREGGDDDSATDPVDSDVDGVPDFRDTDSDDNGRPDGVDGTSDVDGDGQADYADQDDDNDQIDDVDELGPNPANGLDTDDDNIPDFQDTDSDNDTIPDITETDADYDQDGTPNFQDQDSDEDCILDFDEAGGSPPIDSDDDGRFDFLDRDSDNDGLADGSEDANCNGIQDAGETNPTNEDSDGDGVTDLVEDAAGTDPNNGNDNPQAHGDFFFLIPYEDPTTPTEELLRFRTSVQFADLYFSFDITGSMGEEMTAMANATTGVPAIINQLKCPPIGGTCNIDDDCASGAICFNSQCVQDPIVGAGCVPDLWTGVGHWYDNNTFRNTLSVQSNAATTASNISQSLAGGSEIPFQAAQCVADGINCPSPIKNCAATGLGCPGFRYDTVRILIQISDADNQCSGAGCANYTALTAGNALQARGIKFIGLFGTDDDSSLNPATPQTEMVAIGNASGTVDTSGNPFVYPAINSQVVASTKQAVLDIVKGLPLDVTILPTEVPGDAGDAVRFIDYLEVNTSGGTCTDAPNADSNGDGRNDAFPDLIPGTRVCWDVVPIAENTIAPATQEPQLFIARLKVLGDGSTLDTRDIFFLIPPVPLDVPVD